MRQQVRPGSRLRPGGGLGEKFVVEEDVPIGFPILPAIRPAMLAADNKKRLPPGRPVRATAGLHRMDPDESGEWESRLVRFIPPEHPWLTYVVDVRSDSPSNRRHRVFAASV